MKLPILSGAKVVKLLSKEGFSVLGQEGSHVIMSKQVETRKLKPVIPMHRELAVGTLLSIMRQAGMTREEFLQLCEKHL